MSPVVLIGVLAVTAVTGATGHYWVAALGLVVAAAVLLDMRRTSK